MNIATMPPWTDKALAKNANAFSPEIDLREISPLGLFSLFYAFIGAGRLKFEFFTAPEKGGTYTEGAADIVANVSGGGARVASASRACASNVATIKTGAAHNCIAGEYVKVTDMSDSSYNGMFLVASAADATTLTYALVHDDEDEVVDTGGLVGEVKMGVYSFAPVAAMPWLKIKMTEVNIGTIDAANAWLNIH